MPTTYSHQEATRLGSAILKFLDGHLENTRLAPDQFEGLRVAMQCLALVFDTKPEDAKDLPDLMETYNKEAGEMEKPAEATSDEKKEAEEFKSKGNAAMKEKNYSEAITHYTKAIEKNKLSEVYFCNRAAAYTNLEKFHEALDDCKRAIAINQDYAKAFSRMGLIYSKLAFFEESVGCYKEAIKLEPDNEGYKKNLEIVEKKAVVKPADATLDPDAAALGMQAGMNAAGMPPDMAAGSMPEMMAAYQQFAQNPEFGQMAEKVMTNPQMKGMVEQFMSNMGVAQQPGGDPASVNPMESMAQAMGSGANMSDLLQMGQQFASFMQKENPELINNLRNDMASLGGASGLGDSSSAKADDSEKPSESKPE